MGPFGLVGVSTTSLEGAHLVVVDLVVHLVAQRVGNFSDRPWGISVILVTGGQPQVVFVGDEVHHELQVDGKRRHEVDFVETDGQGFPSIGNLAQGQVAAPFDLSQGPGV